MMKKFACVALFAMGGCAPSGFTLGDASLAESDSGMDASSDADGGDGNTDGGETDAGPDVCYLDRDHDGVGAGPFVSCDWVNDPAPVVEDAGSADGGAEGPLPPQVVSRSGDCDDADPTRAPGLVEVCDGIDNDCDDAVDEGARNACGGACVRPFEHELGEACSNGLQGACARDGTYACQSDSILACDAQAVNPSSELCGDAVDNDCDGAVDEPDAVNAAEWYQDCDGDGYAASTAGSMRACAKPADAGGCTWTNVVPQQATSTNWDCDDSRAEYSPASDYGVPPAGSVSFDLNCDGRLTPHPFPYDITTPENGIIFRCEDALVRRLNGSSGERVACDTSGTGRWDGCITWGRAGGTYGTLPEAKCPDARVTKVRVAHEPGGSGPEWVCYTSSVPAVWPCR